MTRRKKIERRSKTSQYNRTSMNASPSFYLKPGQEIDKRRLIYKDPVLHKYNINGKEIAVLRSAAFYLDDQGRECTLLFAGPSELCFGVSADYDDKKPEGCPPDKAIKYLTGYQVCYTMTSKETMSNPTPDEKALKKNIDTLNSAAFEKGLSEAGKDDTILPATVTGAFEKARAKKSIGVAIRPLYTYPKDPTTKQPDTTKSLRMYVKLMTSGKGEKMKVATPFYLPGDVRKNPTAYVGRWGAIEPVFRYDGITWAGKKYAAGQSLVLYEANYKIQASNQHGERFISRNMAEPTDDDGDGDGEGYGGAGRGRRGDDDEVVDSHDFPAPDDGQTPADVLSEVTPSDDAPSEDVPEDEEPRPKAKPDKAAIAAKKAAIEKKKAQIAARKKVEA